MKGGSKASKTRQDKDSTMSSPTLEAIQMELPLFATVALVPPNSEMISQDKSPICNPSTQKQKSSKTSAQDSTSSEKDCKPYWTDFCAQISSKLLLPVETDWADSDLSLSSTWSNKTVAKSWFSTKLYTAQNPNSPKIYSQSFTSSPVECTDSGNTVKKSRRICLKLSPKQKQKIKYWFGVSRFADNETIRYLQQEGTKANWKKLKTGIIQSLPDWVITFLN